MSLFGLILAQVVDALQADGTTAHTVHAQRSEEAREVDNREFADRQTDDLQEWLAAPDETDFVTKDTPAFHTGIYDPIADLERRDD